MPKRWRIVEAEVAKKHPLYGVSGWLLILVIGMVVIGPLLGALSIGGAINSSEREYPGLTSLNEWNSYITVTWCVFIVSAVLSIYAGLGLTFKYEWGSVKRAKAILWISGPGSALCIGLIVPLFIFENSESFDAKFVGMLIASVFSAFIWSSYLNGSKRVRVTFGNSVIEDSFGTSSLSTIKNGNQSGKSVESNATSSIRTCQTIQVERKQEDASNTQIEKIQTPGEIDVDISSSVEDEFYETIGKEVEAGTLKASTWARALAEGGGDDLKTKSLYVNMRIDQLKKEYANAAREKQREAYLAQEKKLIEAATEEQKKKREQILFEFKQEAEESGISGKSPAGFKTIGELEKEANKPGSSHAKYLMGLLYLEGHHVQNDIRVAGEWFAFASAEGYEKASEALNRTLFIMNPNQIQAKERYHHWPEGVSKNIDFIKKCWECGDIYHGVEFIRCKSCKSLLRNCLQRKTPARLHPNQLKIGT